MCKYRRSVAWIIHYEQVNKRSLTEMFFLFRTFGCQTAAFESSKEGKFDAKFQINHDY